LKGEGDWGPNSSKMVEETSSKLCLQAQNPLQNLWKLHFTTLQRAASSSNFEDGLGERANWNDGVHQIRRPLPYSFGQLSLHWLAPLLHICPLIFVIRHRANWWLTFVPIKRGQIYGQISQIFKKYHQIYCQKNSNKNVHLIIASSYPIPLPCFFACPLVPGRIIPIRSRCWGTSRRCCFWWPNSQQTLLSLWILWRYIVDEIQGLNPKHDFRLSKLLFGSIHSPSDLSTNRVPKLGRRILVK
jgi:hypothetical protein